MNANPPAIRRAGRSADPPVGLPPGGGIFRDRLQSAPRALPNSGSVTVSLALASRAFVVSPCPASEGDGTRTRNHRIDSPWDLVPVVFLTHYPYGTCDAIGKPLGRRTCTDFIIFS